MNEVAAVKINLKNKEVGDKFNVTENGKTKEKIVKKKIVHPSGAMTVIVGDSNG